MEIEKITKEKLNINKLIDEVNIAKLIEEDELRKIAQECVCQYQNDKDSRKEREDKLDNAYDMVLNINQGTKSYPWEGASNVLYPLITQGAIEFNAEAYPSIIQDGNMIKVKVIGDDEGLPMPDPKNLKQPVIDPETNQPLFLIPPGEKNRRALRIEKYCNNYILNVMKGWEENQDKLLIALPICGTMFKKIYHDTVEKVAVNDLIFPKFLIVNNNAKSLDDAYSITHEYTLSNNDIKEQQTAGIFLDTDIKFNCEETLNVSEGSKTVNNEKDENTPQVILEQHTFLDLDHDGYKEPYIITIHKSSQEVLRIVARYKEKDIIKNKKGEVLKIKPCQYFVKYSFIPSPDGNFYDIGFADFLFPLNKTVNTLLNQLIDAGTLSNTSMGFIGNGLNIKGGSVGASMGKFKFITNNTGDDIARNIYQLKHPEPSLVLFQLLGFVLDAAKILSNQKDVLSGTLQNNVAPTTMMAQVEQGYKQFKAIYKRVYRALKEEIQLIVEDIKDNESQENYVAVLSSQQANFEKDFSSVDVDIIPLADPNMITSLEKLSQANFLMQFVNNPTINQQELIKKIFTVVRVETPDKLINPPMPQQIDPLVQVEQMKLQQKSASDMANIQMKEKELELKTAESQSKLQLEAVKLENTRLTNSLEMDRKNYELQIRDLKEQNERARVNIAAGEGMVKAKNVDIADKKAVAEIELIQAQTEKTLSEAHDVEPANVAELRRQELKQETVSNS
jgi:chaperonin GroES